MDPTLRFSGSSATTPYTVYKKKEAFCDTGQATTETTLNRPEEDTKSRGPRGGVGRCRSHPPSSVASAWEPPRDDLGRDQYNPRREVRPPPKLGLAGEKSNSVEQKRGRAVPARRGNGTVAERSFQLGERPLAEGRGGEGAGGRKMRGQLIYTDG